MNETTISLYTTHCPQCRVLMKKLEEKGIKYDLVEDVALMASKGFSKVPVLEVDGKIMQFKEAYNYVSTL